MFCCRPIANTCLEPHPTVIDPAAKIEEPVHFPLARRRRRPHPSLIATASAAGAMRQSLSPPRTGLSHVAKTQKPESTSTLDRDDKYEIKCGKLLLLHKVGQKAVWLPVYVRVYRNAFEHFAVVSKDQVVTTNSTYINLKTSICGMPDDSSNSSSSPTSVHSHGNVSGHGSCISHAQFKVVQNNFEGTVINFDAGDRDAVMDWVDAFTSATPPCSPTQGGMSPTLSPAIPRSPVMPTLPELDEEE